MNELARHTYFGHPLSGRFRARLEAGESAIAIAREYRFSPRHVRRLAAAAGWIPVRRGPAPTGRRDHVHARVSPECMAALQRRAEGAGCTVAEAAAALLEATADAPRLRQIIDDAAWATTDHYRAAVLEGILLGIANDKAI